MVMTTNSVIASSKEAFYVWQYKSSKKLTTLEFQSTVNRLGKKDGTERSHFNYFNSLTCPCHIIIIEL